MIKARKKNVIFIGLDKENIDRMLDNKPILFKGEQVGLPGIQIVILAGNTLDDVKEDLRSIGVI